LSCAVGQFDVVVTFPPLPMLADPEQFIFCAASGVLPSGVCFHWLSFC
jgi:2-polyprenyl-3-methyl-5-hydroxy-6-metoxy-1,4-benzoquinol methylase